MPRRILICEDDVVLGQSLRTHLEARGHWVTICHEGATALRLLGEETYSLLLLDLALPDMDGFDVCRRMRASCHIPVLMITGRRGEVERIVGLELGADDYLEKPFGGGELAARVDAHLRRTEAAARGSPARRRAAGRRRGRACRKASPAHDRSLPCDLPACSPSSPCCSLSPPWPPTPHRGPPWWTSPATTTVWR